MRTRQPIPPKKLSAEPRASEPPSAETASSRKAASAKPARKASDATSGTSSRAAAAPARLTRPIVARVETAPDPVGPDIVAEIFARLRAADPEPRAELVYQNPYTLLVAVVLSAQATDKSVNLATAPLFAIADTPEKMLRLGEDRVRDFIRTIGLFNTKAKNVIALSQILVDEHGGAVPRSRAHLEILPGVGTKTASVVLNVAFGEETIAVDTHIFRVSNRIPLVVAPTTDKVQAGLEALVPAPYRLNAHHWLILFGRYICKARRPECHRCPIADLCRYPSKTLAA